MTLIIAAQGQDFVVVGADTRETIDAGSIRVEVNISEKLIKLTNHTAILLCGDSGYAQNLIAKYQVSTLRRRELGITDLTEDFASFCRREETKVRDVPTYKYFPNIGFVVGGLNRENGKFSRPRCYGLSSTRGFRLELGGEGFVLDGKPMLARYLFARYYKPKMNVDELSNLVLRSLFDTSRVDGDVGGKYRMAIIDSKEVRTKTEQEIEEMVEEADLRW